MRTRFSADELSKFEKLTDEIKIAARDIARKFHPSIPNYEPWVFDIYVGESTVTIAWGGGYGCEKEEFDARYEWFDMTDEELDELVEEEEKRKRRLEKYKELDKLKTDLKIKTAAIARMEEQIKDLQEQLGESE
jgi:hypothetical protein